MDTTALPSGTITLLFTDIEGHTRLWEHHPDAMRLALARHDVLLAARIQEHGGQVVKSRGEGDSFFAVFPRPTTALAAAAAVQQALLAEPWPAQTPLRVRMALHVTAAEVREGDYYGPGVIRCARLRAVAHGGQVLLSEATANRVRDHLPAGVSLQDLGSHRLKDLQQPEHIFQLLHPDLPADFPPLRSLEAFAHNLPRQVTSFIGREPEVAEVKQLLSTTALLTLTGAGGCGKTRLALHVAADLVERYQDGVWLVELAALADPSLVPQTVASALGVREEPGSPLMATLGDHLRPRSLLLVLDNCEHLLSTCAQLADALLRICPHLRVLATSREALGTAGETTYRVPSLSLPDPQHLPSLEALRRFEATHLFVDRAAAALPSFTLNGHNATAVAQVCHRLDGIPLAIELAAARVKVLPVEQIAERLDDRFRLLTGGSRTALPRQQTLRALIDWSYDLLSEAEQTLLRRLSVFTGSWTLEAAEAVCSGDDIGEWEVLDGLTALVEKSLVVYEEPDAHAECGWSEARYRLLETVRQYSRDRLMEASEADAVSRRHGDFYLRLAEELEPGTSGGEGGMWLQCSEETVRLGRLESEHDNLRAALDWSLTEEGGTETSLRLAGALGWFWQRRGYRREGEERLLAALARSDREQVGLRAKPLCRAGQLAGDLGDYAAARSLLEESLAIGRELGDRLSIAQALNHLGWVVHGQGDYPAARSLLEECLRLNQELGRKEAASYTLNFLGVIASDQGDYTAARSLTEQYLAIEQELGSKERIASALWELAVVAHLQEDQALARLLVQESLAKYREMDTQTVEIAVSRNELASLAWLLGDPESASLLLKESLPLMRDVGHRKRISASLETLASMAAAQGHLQRAARLFGAAERLREVVGAPLRPHEGAEHDRRVAAVRAVFGEAAFAAAWVEGREISLEAAVSYALEECADA